MNKRMVYKGILILAVIIFAVILVLPTAGKKKMDIFLDNDITPEETEMIMQRFSSDKFTVTKAEGKVTIQAAGLNITDAVMNEARTFKGVKDAKIQPHWAEKAVLAKKVNLGLDLQGGMELVLMADFDKIKEQYIRERNQLLEKQKEKTAALNSAKDNDKDAIKKELEIIDSNLKDINENRLTESNEVRDKLKSEITNQALEMLRNRVDKFGVSEPSIVPRGNDAIEIQLPGVKDSKKVKDLIGTTGSVQYRLVDEPYSTKAAAWLSENFKEKTFPADAEGQKELLLKISREIKLPDQLELLFLFNRDSKTNKLFPYEIMALQREVSLAGNDISKAWVGNDEYGSYIVQFNTTTEGAGKFAKVTGAENRNKRLAIIIDDKIRSAPKINDPIVTGSAQITGDFTLDEVKALANIIQEGALPVGFTFAQETTVGPSMGQDSIQTGLKAILIGLAGLMIFVAVYYKLSGLVAVFGIGLNAVITLAILSWLGFTLTMPGIAGFILTIGLSVDSNVLIYERMKEELRAGKTIKVAIANGFDRAFSAIFDGNVSTLIMSFVFTQYGTGPVKGFAVTLTVGVVSTMFVALVVTKYIFSLIALLNIKKLSI